MTIEAIKRQWELISSGQFSRERFADDGQIIFVALVWVGLIAAMLIFGSCQKDVGGKKAAAIKLRGNKTEVKRAR